MISLRDLLPQLILPLTRMWYKFNKGARILMYHRIADLDNYDQLTVGVENFENQMAWLSSNRKVFSLSDVVERISKGKPDTNLIAVTFDDGYLDNLEYALPILEKYQIPATIFITSDFAAQRKSHPRYQNESKRLHLNWQEVKKLSNHPLITIGSHTITHPMLSEQSDNDALVEVSGSKSEIEASLAMGVRHFCYPSGNFTEREETYVQQCGYISAVTVKPGMNTNKSNLYALRRTEVTDRDSLKLLQQKLDGAFDIFHYLLNVYREWNFFLQRR